MFPVFHHAPDCFHPFLTIIIPGRHDFNYPVDQLSSITIAGVSNLFMHAGAHACSRIGISSRDLGLFIRATYGPE